MLLPRPDPAQEDPEEDPREALMRRLLEHQKFKAAAELLHERETLRSAQWTRPDGPDRRDRGRGAGAGDRGRSLQPDHRLPRRRRADKARPKMYLPSEQIPIEDRIEQLLSRLSETEALRVRGSVRRHQHARGLVVTFLALLEMIRLKLIRVFQSGVVGPDPRLQAGASRRCAAAAARSRAGARRAPGRRGGQETERRQPRR